MMGFLATGARLRGESITQPGPRDSTSERVNEVQNFKEVASVSRESDCVHRGKNPGVPTAWSA
jgi:hypothetical protein